MSRRAPWLDRPLLIAPDAFKGSLRATEVAAAIGRGVERGDPDAPPPDICPVADGGEGTMEVLLTALGGETAAAVVTDPLGRETQAGFGLLEDGDVAIVELAQASGLDLVAPQDRDPEEASSRGTGELIVAAAQTGVEAVLVAAGGSATTDGGAGAIDAINEAGGLADTRLVILSDVRTPFEHAAERFGPQKGADPATVKRLRKRLDGFARKLPRDPRGVEFTGAAGGLAGGLWATFGASLVPGAAHVLEALDFDRRMRAACAVVVGEGRLDRSTLEGKIAAEIAIRARQAGVPAHAIVGSDAIERFDARILDLQTILEAGDLTALERAGEQLATALAANRPGGSRAPSR